MADLSTVTGGGDILGGGGMGVGGGLIGGLILGSLLRNNGNLFGQDGAGAAGAVLRSPPEQVQANMSIMQSLGQIDKAVAVGTAAMEGSQANQSAAFTSQLNAATGSLATRVDSTREAVNANAMVLAQQLSTINTNLMTTANETQRAVYDDGDKTRALITSQYEAMLNRQLSDANAAVIALQNRFDNAERTRGVEVTTTNNINQMQQQTQQQQQYGQLYHAIYSLAQGIQATNQAINVGTGTQTANPLNNNTNIR
jgi:hypothetical protein